MRRTSDTPLLPGLMAIVNWLKPLCARPLSATVRAGVTPGILIFTEETERGPAKSTSVWDPPGRNITPPDAAVLPAVSLGSVPALFHAARTAVLSSVPVQVVTCASGR